MKIRTFGLAFVVFALALTGCSLSSYQKAQMDETLEKFYVTRFEFGKIGSIDVATAKELVLDGRNWNFSELLSSVFQDALKDRGFAVGELLPTKGGAYALDELRVSGRTLLVSPVWYASGNIRTTYMPPRIPNANAKAIKSIPTQAFMNTSKHYESDENFFEGLKTELRPQVDIILDDVFHIIHEYGLKDF
ncbi:MAG: hypothetical protein DELT_02225 [Desulfovibrio sp.]